MADPMISRVYDLKIAGYDDSLVKVKELTAAFGKMDAAKKKLNEQLQKKLDSGDVTAIKELSARIKELEGNMSNLSAKRESSAKEVLLQAQAEKNLAAAEKTRMSNIIQQEKELDRLIAKEEKQNRTVQQSSGYYYDLLNAQKAALQIYRQTPPTDPFYEQVKKNAIDAKAKVDAFNRSLSPDGTLVGEYKTGILNAFKNLGLSDVLKKQSNDVNTQLNALKEESRQLATEYKKAADSGTKSFAEIEHQLKNNLEQQEKLKSSLNNLETALQGTGNIGSQITSGIAKGFKEARTQVAQLLLGYVGFQAVFSGLRDGVGIAKELSDQTTNLEIELDKTAGGLDKIVDSLSKLNTRTKLTVLEDIANVAAKAGVSEDKIVDVTAAIDKIKVAFGKDFGDVETGTESLVKLINIFEGTENVTGDSLLRVGNAVRTLANESTASVPFLNDFSKRMAGLKGISNIALPAVLGLASGFEQFGQMSETAGTALTKVIPKLGTDTEKYAKIAGLTQQAFSDLLKNDPAEALIKVSEGLVKSGAGIEDISKAFADSELGSGRIAAILGTVADHADEFRKSIHSAGVAYKDTGNIETAFAEKNKNLASELDKISKAFADAAGSKAFQATISAVSGVILLLINNLPALITVLALYTAGWALANKQMLIGKAELIFQRTMLPVLTFLFGGQANALKAYAVATSLAGKAMATLTRLMGNPIFKIFVAGLGLSLIALKSFGLAVNNSVAALDKYAQKQRFINEINAEASKSLTEIKVKEEILLGIIKDRTLADQTRANALEKLKTLMGEYGKDLTLETVLTNKGTEALKAFNEQLLQKARNTAAAAIAEREGAKLSTLIQYQSDIQTAIRSNGSVNTSQFDKDFIDKYYKQQGRSASAIGKFIGDKLGIDFTYSGKDLQAFSNLVKSEIDKQVTKTSGAELAKIEVENKTKVTADVKKLNDNPVKVKPVEIDIEALKKDIEEYDKKISEFKGSQAALNKLLSERKKLQDRMDAAMGNNKSAPSTNFRGSRLNANDQDQLKIIEANRSRLLAIENTSVNEIQKVRELSFGEEKAHLLKVEQINVDALNNKIALLSQKKKLNAEEKKQIAEFTEQRSSIELDTSKKTNDLLQKDFDERAKKFKENLDSQIENAKAANKQIQDNVDADPSTKAQAQLDSDNAILKAQVEFFFQMDFLEKAFNKVSKKNAEDRARDAKATNDAVNKDKKAVSVSILSDIEKDTNEDIARIKLKYEQLIQGILKSNKSLSDKDNAIKLLVKVENIEVKGTEQKGNNKALEEARKLFEQNKITAAEFVEIYKAANKGQQDLNNAIEEGKTQITSFQSLLGNKLGKLFGLAQGSDQAKVFAETIAGAFNTAGEAMNNYYDAEANRIERSSQIAQKKLDIELQQRKDSAQSQAESDSLERQFAAKKDAENRKAFEKNKKLQKEQAKINLAIQLSNLAVIAFSPNPLNIATLGIAGAIMYGVQAALAFVNYASNISKINSAQYAQGGYTGPGTQRDSTGHKVAGVVHEEEWVSPKWMVKHPKYGPVIQELEGVRKRGFATGGFTSIMAYPSTVHSDNLRPPVNPSSFLHPTANNNQEEMQELRNMVAQTTATVLQVSRQTNERIDKIKVEVVSKEVEDSNNNRKKASAIGTV